MPTFIGTNPAPGGERRIIKRYSNRKLYDTRDSRYVTLLDLGELIRNGQDIQVIDKATERSSSPGRAAYRYRRSAPWRENGVSV